jgi:GAF domain-containing protein
MISVIRRFLTTGYNYLTPLARQRARSLLVMNALLVIGWGVYLIVFVVPRLTRGELLETFVLIALFVFPVLSVTIHGFIRSGRLTLAIWLFILMLGVAVIPLNVSGLIDGLPILVVIPMVAAGVLLGRRSFALVLLILMALLLIRAGAQSQVAQRDILAEIFRYEFIVSFLVIILSAVFLYVFSGSAQSISTTLGDDVHHLHMVGAFAESEDEDSLLATALRTVQSELGYSLGQIFLVSGDGSTQRRVRLGIGESDLTSSSVVNPGDDAVIRHVVSTRRGVMVTARDEQPRRSHLIVSALRALAVPIVNADRVLGVLDVQSTYSWTFSENQVEAFHLLGQRLGEALFRARLLTDLRRSLREREEAATYMRAQLVEMQRRDRELLASGWSTYLQSRGQLFGYDLQNQNGNLVAAADLPAEIRAALERGDVFVETRADEQIINAPIVFRGEVLGAMSFIVAAERPVTERELDMVRTVANRLGVALENNRLLEQTQAQAQRERKASEVANVLLTATNIETLMELAADNFNEALDAIYTRIYLEPGVVAEPPATRGEPV